MKKIVSQIIVFVVQKERAVIAALVVAAILLGSAYSLYLGNNLRYPDEEDYYSIAVNLVTSQVYTIDGSHPTAFRPPGYPLILAFFALVNSSVIFLRIINFIALGVSIYLLHRILREQVAPLSGVIGGLLVFAYPVLFYTAGTLYPQTIAGCLLLLIIYMSSRKRSSVVPHALIGFLFGYLVLMIPNVLAILPVLLIWMVIIDKTKIRYAAIVFLVAILTITPWTIRNYTTFGTFVFISSNFGLNLLLGNSENTTPNAGVTVDISKYDAVASKLDEIERDAYYRSAAIRFISENRYYTVKMYFLKLANHFNYRNQLETGSEASRMGDIIMLLSYGFILLLVIVRMILSRRYPLSLLELLILLLYLGNALVSAVFFTRIRFRLPFDLLLIIIAATSLHHGIMVIFSSQDLLSSSNSVPMKSASRPGRRR